MTAVAPTRSRVTRWSAGFAEDRGALILGVISAVIVLSWVGSNGFRQSLAMTAATYALVALGMYVPFVLAGSLSLAYSAYASIGGYAVGIVSEKSHLPLLLGWIAGPIVAAILAAILGLVTRRLSGFYLAAVTLLFSTAFAAWLTDAEGITGGSSGIGNLRTLSIFGWTPTPYQFLVLAVVLVVVVSFLLDRLRLSRWGVVVRTVREAPRAVEASGARVPTLTIAALAIGAGIAALGGAMFTYSVGSITPDTFTLNVVFLAIFMPLLGGTGTPWGAVVGALITVELTLNFDAVKTSGTLLLSLAVLLVMLLASRGVLGYLDELRRRGLALLSRNGSGHG